MELIGRDALKTVSAESVRKAVQDALSAAEDLGSSRSFVVVEITDTGARHVAHRMTEQPSRPESSKD